MINELKVNYRLNAVCKILQTSKKIFRDGAGKFYLKKGLISIKPVDATDM